MTPSRSRWVGVAGVVLATLTLAASAVAAEASPAPNPKRIAFEDFARRPTMSDFSFSPSGDRFAVLRRDESGRKNLVVGDTQTKRLLQITSFTKTDVAGYFWVGEGRLIFTVYQSDKGNAEQRFAGGAYAINVDGTEGKDLTDKQRGFRMLRRIPGQDTDILAIAGDRDEESPDVVRLNTRTGKRVVITRKNPGNVVRWVLDAHDVPRAAVSCKGEELTCDFWLRDSEDAPWRKVAGGDDFSPRMQPAFFLPDGTLVVTSNLNSDREGLFLFDPKTNLPGEKLLDHPTADVTGEGAIMTATDRRLLGVEIDADKPEFAWFDEESAKVHKLMEVSLPKGNVNTIRRLENGRYAVTSRGDRFPTTYYLYDPAGPRLEEVLRPADWFDPDQLATMTPIRYKARDGLEIPAYLSLPAGKPAKGLPLLVWVHGGPWARDDWGLNPEVQMFASRGYAVLQPNYRGSTGFGLRHLTSSFKQLGLSMQDDVTDGVKYLIAQGIVDANRVCIGGGSYGGYATMMGLIREPQMFKCGIDVVGVTDLIWWHELGYTDFNSTNPAAAGAHLSRTVGDPKTDRQLLERNSPRNLADKVMAPVLIIHGAEDHRVPIRHAEAMRSALQAAGKTVEWQVYEGEGHGFSKREHLIDYYTRMIDFLDRHIGDKRP